ncbi:hypothetical protein FRB94_009621 [Tulasnella sp. JGI-2019a]|nr:hypothetical protein FRB94_009621 [Tulasnella sp. JGI-2019a]KAG9017761.1 hypothetical protein FRB93_004572 [Tulasnella sp. JGI-2019a]
MIFAFGPHNSFFVSNGSAWAGNDLPAELLNYANSDPALSMDQITAITLFPNNGWYVAHGARWATNNVPLPIAQAVNALPKGFSSVASIEFDAANPSSFIISVNTGDPEFAELPPMLTEKVLKMCFEGIQGFWLGHAGSHVVTSTTGRFMLNLNTVEDSNTLMTFMKTSKINTLVLSPFNSAHFFATLANGKTVWFTPQTWHTVITAVSTTSNSGVRSGMLYNPGVPNTGAIQSFGGGLAFNAPSMYANMFQPPPVVIQTQTPTGGEGGSQMSAFITGAKLMGNILGSPLTQQILGGGLATLGTS